MAVKIKAIEINKLIPNLIYKLKNLEQTKYLKSKNKLGAR
jgi:hypothetical protein